MGDVKRRWSVNDYEQASLSDALAFMAGHRVRWSVDLYAELLPGDPEPSPEDVATDAEGKRWVWVPTEVAEVAVSVTAPRWVLE